MTGGGGAALSATTVPRSTRTTGAPRLHAGAGAPVGRRRARRPSHVPSSRCRRRSVGRSSTSERTSTVRRKNPRTVGRATIRGALTSVSPRAVRTTTPRASRVPRSVPRSSAMVRVPSNCRANAASMLRRVASRPTPVRVSTATAKSATNAAARATRATKPGTTIRRRTQTGQNGRTRPHQRPKVRRPREGPAEKGGRGWRVCGWVSL